MCDGCQGEVHLKSCSGFRQKPNDDSPFYCRGCKARRERQARAATVAAAEEEAAAVAVGSAEGVTPAGVGVGGGAGGEGGGSGKEGGDKGSTPAPRKVVARMEFCEETEDEQRRKRREASLKVGWGWGACSFGACLTRLAVDHAFLSARATVWSCNRDTSNILAHISYFPYAVLRKGGRGEGVLISCMVVGGKGVRWAKGVGAVCMYVFEVWLMVGGSTHCRVGLRFCLVEEW